MNVAKILSVVFEGDTGDKGDISSKALESNDYSPHSLVPQVSPNEIPWGTNSEPKGDSENHTNQPLKGVCPPVPHVPRIFADGRNLRMGGVEFRVVGVMDTWLPVPKFYDVSTGPFGEPEEVFFPFNLIVTLELSRNGNTNCWKSPDGDGLQAFLNSECVWIQFWAELPNDEAKREYLAFLDNYVSEQKSLGRFQRPLNNRVSDVMEWMENQQVVLDDAKIVLALAVMFLVVCILNTIGLLLSKFLGKAPEIGLRRALGASKRTLLAQHLIEAACIGLVGGLLGLVLTWFGLRGIESLFGGISKELVRLDWVMVGSAVALALVSSVVAGLYPTWRACSVAPASQLKSQ